MLSSAGTDTPDGNVEWIKQVTKLYSEGSWDLLMQYENLPEEVESSRKGGWTVAMKKPVKTFHALRGEVGKTEMIDYMASNIRVISLALQRLQAFQHTKKNSILLDWECAEAFFYLAPTSSFYVSFPMKSLYPARDLASVIPDRHRTPLFDAMIFECRNAQRFGIIGLLEEFHSYYSESRFYADMLPAYRASVKSDADGFLSWVQNSQSTLGAYFEFDFFLMEYLLHLKEKYPGNYEALKSCRSFQGAYGAIRLSYGNLIGQYRNLIEAEIKRLNASGKIVAGFDGGTVWVKADDGIQSRGTRVFEDTKKLAAALDGDRYQRIMADFPKQ